MKFIGWTVTFIVGATLSYILRGWALSILWGWFIVETFKLPSINIPKAIGLSLIIGFLTYQISENDDKEPGEAIPRLIAVGISYPLIAVFTGWVITFFM